MQTNELRCEKIATTRNDVVCDDVYDGDDESESGTARKETEICVWSGYCCSHSCINEFLFAKVIIELGMKVEHW